MQVVMVAPARTRCGVVAYTRALTVRLSGMAGVTTVELPSMTNRREGRTRAEQASSADVVHVQYHPDYCGFWRTPLKLQNFVRFVRAVRVPRVVTVHDLPHRLRFRRYARPSLRGLAYNALAVPLVGGTSYGRFLLGRFLDAADRLIVHTAETKRFLESLRIPAEKIAVVYPGVPDLETGDTFAVRESLGWPDRKILTVFGYVTPEKGYETVLEALTKLPREWSLLIAGGPRGASYQGYAEQLTRLIHEMGLAERVKRTGYLREEHVGPVLAASDVVVLSYRPTVMRGVSYALGYALAAGRPIVASATEYFREIEETTAAITIFESGDAEALASAVRDALEGLRQPAHPATDLPRIWSWERVATETYGIYEAALRRNGRVR